MSEKNDQQGLPNWALPALSWLVSFYFLFGFAFNTEYPPDRSLFAGDALFIFLWLFFLFLPFFSKVKIGKLLELEREVGRTKQDLQDFKIETRNSLAVLSTNVNTMGNMTNQITVNVPASQDSQSAKPSEERQVAKPLDEQLQSARPIEDLQAAKSEVSGPARQAVADATASDAAESLAINPKNSLAPNSRGEAYLSLGRFEDAVRGATTALETNPKDSIALRIRAEAYRLLGQYDGAVRDATASLEIDPKSNFALNARSEAYLGLGRFEDAIRDATA